MKFLGSICLAALLQQSSGFSLGAAPTIRESTTSLHTKLDGRTIRGDLVPLNNFLLVKIADMKEQTDGGILLTGKAKVKKAEGRVVSAGPGSTHKDSGIVFGMSVAAGEGVVYGKYDGTEIDIDGAKHMLIRDEDILVKFDGDELTMETADVTNDSVLVYVERKESSTEGGILIAKSSKVENRPSTGKVVKVGPGKMAASGDLMPMEVTEGDMVKFRDFAGNEVIIAEEEYSVVRMADVLAKF